MRTIMAKNYHDYCKHMDSEKITLQKERTFFMYKTQSFIMEKFVNVPGKPTILRVSTTNENVELPPFVQIEREITKDRSFASANLAKLSL